MGLPSVSMMSSFPSKWSFKKKNRCHSWPTTQEVCGSPCQVRGIQRTGRASSSRVHSVWNEKGTDHPRDHINATESVQSLGQSPAEMSAQSGVSRGPGRFGTHFPGGAEFWWVERREGARWGKPWEPRQTRELREQLGKLEGWLDPEHGSPQGQPKESGPRAVS